MGKVRDILGQKFNRLTVLKKLDYKHPHGGFMWLCECECGNKLEVPMYRITSGDITSCGCQKKELMKKNKNRKPTITFKEFIEKFDNRYSLSCINWIGVVNSLVEIECNIHGKTVKTSDQLRQITTPCALCSNEQRAISKSQEYDEIIKKCTDFYDGRYLYPESNREKYINQKSIIEIICNEHGLFEKRVSKHLRGQSCFDCKVDELIKNGILIGGYSEFVFRDNPEIAKTKGFIYYLKVGDFYKIGITRLDIKNRIRAIKSVSKLHVELIDIKEMKMIDAYRIEQTILNKHEKERVREKWSSELFNCDVLNGII